MHGLLNFEIDLFICEVKYVIVIKFHEILAAKLPWSGPLAVSSKNDSHCFGHDFYG